MPKMLVTAMVLSSLISYAMADDFNSIPRDGQVKNHCGFYVVLGCDKNQAPIRQLRDFWGGPGAGGGAGLTVADTAQYPNFRDDYYCLIDGPYMTYQQASEVAWKEAIPDSYVKNGC